MRLTFSQMRLAFSKMQGAFPPTASRIFENARRIFRSLPVSRFSQTEYASDIWQSERRMNVITFFRETMWFSRGNYITLFILYTKIFSASLADIWSYSP